MGEKIKNNMEKEKKDLERELSRLFEITLNLENEMNKIILSA